MSADLQCLRTSREFCEVFHFFQLFRQPLLLPKFTLEDFEQAILMSESGSKLLEDIHERILQAESFSDVAVNSKTWRDVLRQRITELQEHESWGDTNPLEQVDYDDLPLQDRLKIMQALCYWHLDTNEKMQEPENAEQCDLLRLRPLGFDGSWNAYYHFGGSRLYVSNEAEQHNPKKSFNPLKGTPPAWSLAANGMSEMEDLGARLAQSRNKGDKKLGTHLNSYIIPDLQQAAERMAKAAEKQDRLALLEANRRVSNRAILMESRKMEEEKRREAERDEEDRRRAIKEEERLKKLAEQEERRQKQEEQDQLEAEQRAADRERQLREERSRQRDLLREAEVLKQHQAEARRQRNQRLQEMRENPEAVKEREREERAEQQRAAERERPPGLKASSKTSHKLSRADSHSPRPRKAPRPAGGAGGTSSSNGSAQAPAPPPAMSTSGRARKTPSWMTDYLSIEEADALKLKQQEEERQLKQQQQAEARLQRQAITERRQRERQEQRQQQRQQRRMDEAEAQSEYSKPYLTNTAQARAARYNRQRGLPEEAQDPHQQHHQQHYQRHYQQHYHTGAHTGLDDMDNGSRDSGCSASRSRSPSPRHSPDFGHSADFDDRTSPSRPLYGHDGQDDWVDSMSDASGSEHDHEDEDGRHGHYVQPEAYGQGKPFYSAH